VFELMPAVPEGKLVLTAKPKPSATPSATSKN